MFQEELTNGSLAGENTAVKVTEEFGSTENPVVYLESISSDSHQEFPDVIAVQVSGQITCFSGGLKEKLWSAEIPQTESIGGREVEYVSVQEASTAKQGFLKGRPDILAILEPSSTRTTDRDNTTNVLVLISRTRKANSATELERMAHVVSVRPRLSGSDRRNRVQPLLAWTLPSPVAASTVGQKSQYSFGKKSGLLQQLCGGSLHVYDLNGLTPQLLSTIAQPDDAISSFLPISSGTTLTSSTSYCGIWDIRYRSVYALQTAAIQSDPANQLKRKRPLTEALDTPLAFLEYFPSLDVAIATAGAQLVSVQVRSSAQIKRRRTDRVRLVDCLGKSMTVPRSFVSANGSSSTEFALWEAGLQGMDGAALRRNGKEFDYIFTGALSGKAKESAGPIENAKPGTGIRIEEIQEVVLYALGKLFTWSSSLATKSSNPRVSSIRMVFRAKKTLAWLVGEGHLSPSNVEIALRRRVSLSKSQATVTSRDLIVAFANFDSTLALLCKFIGATRLDLDGASEAAKILLQSFDVPPRLSDDRLLTNGMNGATETEVEAEEEAAEKDLTVAASLLNGEPDIRGNALQYVLEYLARCFPPSELVRSLRLRLSRRDITLLVELLRVALSEGGWTSRYLDFFPTDVDDITVNQDEALSSICILLNCALDALGTGGWLGGSMNESDEEDGDTLLSQLRVETSAVLEGVQESTFFAGFLKDFVRYEKLVKENPTLSKKPRDTKVVASTQQDVGSVLPLGVKAADKISTTKISAGGEVTKRSQRDIGQSISERIGKYTFETIKV